MLEQEFRLIPLLVNDGITNMAIDESILIARSENKVPNTIRFYKWNPSTASIGRNQSVSREINLDTAKRYNVDIVRRISGGGAVYHDKENEITYMVVINEQELKQIFDRVKYSLYDKNGLNIKQNPMAIDSFLPDEEIESNNVKNLNEIYEKKNGENSIFNIENSYHVITMGLVKGLELLGIKIDQGVIHCPALFINKRKISGNAQARRNNTILQHGTILLKVDPEFMYTILKAPEGVPVKRMVASVRAKVCGIFDCIKPLKDNELVEYFIAGFEKALNIKCKLGTLTDYELKLVEEIKQKRKNNDWINRIP